MTHARSSPPIACTLPADAYAERISWIAELNRKYLRAYERDGGVLELFYDREALPAVRELVDRERECCPFLSLDLHEEDELTFLRVEAPPEAKAAFTELLSPFLHPGRAD